jgi:hypothetical protein
MTLVPVAVRPLRAAACLAGGGHWSLQAAAGAETGAEVGDDGRWMRVDWQIRALTHSLAAASC